MINNAIYENFKVLNLLLADLEAMTHKQACTLLEQDFSSGEFEIVILQLINEATVAQDDADILDIKNVLDTGFPKWRETAVGQHLLKCITRGDS